MYDYDESEDTSEDESSNISTLSSGSESDESESDKEVADDEALAVRNIKIFLEEMVSTKIVTMKLGLNGDDREDIIDKYISTVVNIVKNFDNLDNYNTELMVIAACYDLIYKGVLDTKSITNFIDNKFWSKSHDPIDIIRYVTAYLNKK
jgi:hypothetical protein